MNTRTFHMTAFGCQMNKLDAELVEAALLRRGHRRVDDPAEADVILYATCSVRAHAENRVLSHLGALRERCEREPGLIVGIMGCMGQRMGEDICRRFGHVRLVCGTRAFLNIPAYVDEIAATGRTIIALEDGPVAFVRDADAPGHDFHAFVSVMRGCDNFCAYCIVPHVRGHERSRPADEIVDEVRRLCDAGVVAVTLLGQNVNSYGRGLDEDVTLPRLLERIDAVPGLRRVRFVTSHPKDVDEDLFRAMAGLPTVCEHIHVPAQSGADAVLERMRRRYTRADYAGLIDAGRRIVPGIEFSGDFLVGFPGETDADFDESLRLLEYVRYQQSFLFKYSPRPGTLAAEWDDDVPDAVKRERNQRMLAAQERVDRERREALVGQDVEVMVEGENAGASGGPAWRGRTRQNDIVFFDGSARAPGDVVPVRVTGATALTLFGESGPTTGCSASGSPRP